MTEFLRTFGFPALTRESMTHVLCMIFIRQKQKPRLENRRRNQYPRTSYKSTGTYSVTKLNRLVTKKATELLNTMLDAEVEQVRRGDGIKETEGRRELPARGHPGDNRLSAGRVPGQAPQEDLHEQHDLSD